MCREHGRYASAAQLEEVVALFRSAQAHYKAIVAGAAQ
jgi:hypothetical protein